MQVNISSGKYNIMESNQVFLFHENDDLEIGINPNDEFEFSIVLKFLTDDSGESKISSIIDGKNIILSCVNFADKGTGLNTPVRIASVNDKEWFFMFWSYLEGMGNSKVRSVKYTIFCEK